MNSEELELSVDELQNIQAGNSQGMSEATALNHPESFRESQIKKLQETREKLKLTEKKLQDVQAGNTQGMSETSALKHPDLFRKSKIDELKKEIQEYDENIEETTTKRS